ncbi:3'-5' exonuclease, partial [Acetobacteraceae bacterium]|nr:3'-5' exonuclease [Acetobacteraceae bacterium]
SCRPRRYVTAHLLLRMLALASIEQMVDWTSQPKLLPLMPFGKHHGTSWPELPLDYLQWLVRQTEMDADVIYCGRREIERRQQAEP